MKIVVVGAGKVGYYLTKTLLEHHHEPRLIERDRAACTRVANELDIPVTWGDGTTVDVLETAKIGEADALIAVTGRDQDNLVACQLAKQKFQVHRTVARINNPKNAEVMKILGVDIPISATDNIARLLEREVDTAAIRAVMPLNRGRASLSELQIPADCPVAGKRLMEIALPEDCVIVTITRDGDLIIPRGNAQILAGDKLMVVCANTVLQELSQRFGLKEE